MSSAGESLPRSPFSREPNQTGPPRNIPILPSTAASSESPREDPMDVTPSASTPMGPPRHSSPDTEHAGSGNNSVSAEGGGSNMSESGPGLGAAAAAAAAAQQPKVVQTAFIHKLYNMLEDPSIQHLISWAPTNESFVMSPSTEFSKVLAQYFKHTNISSFVRQLNMYGFHKVSDVFQTGAPDTPLWEFKHGNGNFKRGDLVGLREIKRRASRHALIHRDSFSSGHKTTTTQPGTPAEPMPDATEARLNGLEHSLYDMHSRLVRAEEGYALINSRCQTLTEGLMRSHQWNQDLTGFIMALVPDPENQMHRDAPLSPRQIAQDDPRRQSMLGPPRQNLFRPPVPSHLAISPRRYGSIGTANSSPNSARSHVPPPPPPPPQHSLASVTSPAANLSRRHTSADIRLHGWQAAPGGSPFGSGQSSTQWPSSPNRTPNPGDQQLRDALAQYEIRNSRPHGSRQATPPLTSDTTPSNLSVESGWSFGGPRYSLKPTDTPGPPTRRSSMASNVHSLLNPAETAERADEDDPISDDRKRKRMQ
ncbi:MAG: hypothetical protein M1819_006437 [Sarea resinae]|nr:MAG: hypothetical protein M1819_006437 [Sarea resinae]